MGSFTGKEHEVLYSVDHVFRSNLDDIKGTAESRLCSVASITVAKSNRFSMNTACFVLDLVPFAEIEKEKFEISIKCYNVSKEL